MLVKVIHLYGFFDYSSMGISYQNIAFDEKVKRYTH